MSIPMLERAALELEPFLGEIVFVGGATVALWITDLEERSRAHGLRNDVASTVICRWRAGSPGDELLVDAMPSDAAILGFQNRWQRPALDRASNLELPSGRRIRAISPPYLLATKLEAWNGRGRGDLLRSHDLEDVVVLVDGRAELLDEVRRAPADLRAFLAAE